MRFGAFSATDAAKPVKRGLRSVYGKSVMVKKMLVHTRYETAVYASGRATFGTFEVEMLFVRAVVTVFRALSDSAYEFRDASVRYEVLKTTVDRRF